MPRRAYVVDRVRVHEAHAIEFGCDEGHTSGGVFTQLARALGKKIVEIADCILAGFAAPGTDGAGRLKRN